MEVTPAEVLDLTGDTVTQQTINLARLVLSTELGFDLSDAETVAKLQVGDIALIRQALIWQAVYQQKNPDLGRDRSIASVSVPGVSVSYRADLDFPISPLAARSLLWLSWKSTDTVTVTPVGMRPADDPRYRPEPDPWCRVRRY